MKKQILLILVLCCCQVITACAQAYENRNYDWDSKPVPHTLTADDKKEQAVIVKEKKVVEFVYDKDGMPEQYVTRHKIIHINESKSVEEFNRIYIAIDDPLDLKTFKARSISPDGKVKEMLKGDMKDITEEGQRYMILAVEGLEKDSELEYFYTIKKDPTFFGSEIMQGSYMQKFTELSIITPENLVFLSKSYNGFPELKDSVLERKRMLTASVDMIKPTGNEKYSNAGSRRMRVEYKLERNTAKNNDRLNTFADAGKRIYNNYVVDDKADLKAVARLVDKLKVEGKSEEEKIRTIENHIKVTFNLVKGANNKNLVEVIKNNYGSEYEIRRLCLAMLQAAQVKTEIVLTSDKYVRKFDPDFDGWNFLDELFFYFPSINKYMDPTNYIYRLGQLSYQFTGSSAMFVKPVELGGITSTVTNIKKLPEATLAENYMNMEMNVTFAVDMKNVKEHLKETYSGYPAHGIRPYYFYSPEDKREELVKEILKLGMEDAKITNIKVVNYNLNTDEVKKEFIVEADLEASSLLDKAGDTYLFKIGALIGPQEEMYQEKPRQQPAEMDFPHSYLRKITVQIPAGYKAKGLDVLNIEFNGGKGREKAMGFKSSYTLEGNTLTVTVYEFYEQLSYPVEEFNDFRKVINAAADFNKITIVLEKS